VVSSRLVAAGKLGVDQSQPCIRRPECAKKTGESTQRPALNAGPLQGRSSGHRTIENTIHYVCDVTQGEDHSTIRTGHGPHVMAALRNTANNIARLRGHTNMARAQRNASWPPETINGAIRAA
jgi:hypothetical protein